MLTAMEQSLARKNHIDTLKIVGTHKGQIKNLSKLGLVRKIPRFFIPWAR